MVHNAFKQAVLISSLACALAITGCSKQTPEDHLMAADQYLEANNPQAAILELKNALQLAPRSGEARFKLGNIYIEQKQYESAEKELNRALELGYEPAKVLPLLSLAYKQSGATNALADIDHSVAAIGASERAKLGYYKLTALVDLESNDEALALIEELEGLDTQSVYRGLVLAYVPIIEQQYETALEQTLTLRQQAPLNEDVLQLLARLHLFLQQQEQAAEVMAELSKLVPDNLEFQFTYVALLMDLGRYKQADPIVDKLLALNSENGLLNQFKGVILTSENDFEPALGHLQSALANGRDNLIVRLLTGYSAYRLEDYETAIVHLSNIAGSLPGGHPGLRILADSQLLLGQSQEALKTLENFDNTSESDATLFNRTGFQLIRQGDIEAARNVVNQGTSISKTAEELLRSGLLQLSLNDVEGFLKLEQAVQQAPESELTQKTLASAYLVAGEWDKAAELANSWKAQHPEAYEPYLLAGEVAVRRQNYEEAKSEFAKAIGIAPNNPEPKLAQANLAIIQGDSKTGMAQIQALLMDHPDHVASLAVYYALSAQQGDTSDATSKIESGLAKDPERLNMRMLLARVQFQQQEFEQVLSTLEPVTSSERLPVLYWQLMGQSLLRTSEVGKAEALYLRWLDVAPFSKDATLGLLLTLDIQNQFQKAYDAAESFAQKRDDAQINVLRAYFGTLLRKSEQARALLETLPEQAKALPFVRGIYARLALSDNRFNDALPDAKIAYEAQSGLRNLLVYVRALEGSGQAEQGFTTVKTYVENNPQDPRGQVLYAERLISRDKVAAISVYEQTLKALPDNFLMLNNLAYLYFEQGRVDDALPLAERAVSLRPSSAEATDTLAQIYVSQGDLSRARGLYDKVVVNPVQSDEVMINFIDLLVRMGDKELAKRRTSDRKWRTTEAKAQAEALLSGS